MLCSYPSFFLFFVSKVIFWATPDLLPNTGGRFKRSHEKLFHIQVSQKTETASFLYKYRSNVFKTIGGVNFSLRTALFFFCNYIHPVHVSCCYSTSTDISQSPPPGVLMKWFVVCKSRHRFHLTKSNQTSRECGGSMTLYVSLFPKSAQGKWACMVNEKTPGQI